VNGNSRQQRLHRRLANEGIEKLGRAESRQDSCRDSAADVDTAGRTILKGKVARLGPVDRKKHAQRLLTQAIAPRQGEAADDGRLVFTGERSGDGGALGREPVLFQEVVEVREAASGEHTISCGASEPISKKTDEPVFPSVSRREIGVAAL